MSEPEHDAYCDHCESTVFATIDTDTMTWCCRCCYNEVRPIQPSEK